jgi:hypothetical protein
VAPSLTERRSGWFRRKGGDVDVIGADFFADPVFVAIPESAVGRHPSDIPEISFFREGGPDRESGDLVAGLFDGALDLLLLGLPSFE